MEVAGGSGWVAAPVEALEERLRRLEDEERGHEEDEEEWLSLVPPLLAFVLMLAMARDEVLALGELDDFAERRACNLPVACGDHTRGSQSAPNRADSARAADEVTTLTALTQPAQPTKSPL